MPTATGLAFLTATMLFIPCLATVIVMYQETRSWRWTGLSLTLHIALVPIAGTAVDYSAHWLGSGTVR